ncbi:RNA pseudouridine synthase [Polymorphobacter glacialis]|uniref:RNA pseudouridine synthase n=1 Tax=Sandarakinorhabdus glacialis TaxID=1614636 RepID=A0A917E5Q6_9SPHN|nr:RNA pseudouridine synthase [Polymorphobacter glacialis]
MTAISDETFPLLLHGMPFAILHRDTHVVIIDKPAGMAVHPGPKTPDSLEDYLPDLAFGNQRLPVMAHRLDRDTSGCLIISRHPKSIKRVSTLFEAGKVKKLYWAVLDGLPEEDSGTVDAPLLKISSAEEGWRMIIDKRGKRAVTHWEVIDRAAKLVAFRPETGRTHQLRVHAAALGFPILGDPVYGKGQGPMRLHARGITLPYDEAAPLVITAALPKDWPSQALFSPANGTALPI